MLFKPVSGNVSEDKVHGLSDLLFEVLSGSGEDLHSKARSMLEQIFAFEGVLMESETGARRVVRYLYLKLINAIDVAKQMPLFDELTQAMLKVL